MHDGSWQDVAMPDLKEYVTEEHNPENQKGVDGAEVFIPSPLLSTGMCFVDTPGLGSVFTGNTAATHAFLTLMQRWLWLGPIRQLQVRS
jgi:hypothetical protein